MDPAAETEAPGLRRRGLAEAHALDPAADNESVRCGHMAILKRLRDRARSGGDALLRRLHGRAVSFTATLPGRLRGLGELKIEAESQPQSGGAQLRLRTHLRLPGMQQWFELRASREPLDEGSRALLPEQLPRLGFSPSPDRTLQTWAGAMPPTPQRPVPSFGFLGLLLMDQRRLPTFLQRRLKKPFAVSVAGASVVDPLSKR